MSKLIDLTGQSFGYWKVLHRAKNDKSGKAYWHCLCTACGKEKDVSGSHLRAGRTTNCGCIKMEKMRQSRIKDETGNKYGFLEVIRQATTEEKPRNDRFGTYWVCKCNNCGRTNIVIFGDYLRNGDTISCGCVNSKNESKIAKLLTNKNISFKTQIYFQDLYSNNIKNKLYFDFAIYNNNKLLYLIEYDGIQHFEKGHFNNTFEQTHKNDLLKNNYCFNNNIPLIRIPYNEKYKIEDLLLETTRFLLTKENMNNYYEKRVN